MINHDELLAILAQKQYLLFQSKLLSENIFDIASFLEEIPVEKAIVIFRLLPKDSASDVFAELFPETQQAIISSLTDVEIGAIINELYIDDAVDFIEEMPAGIVKKVLSIADSQTRTQINHMLQYPDNSAGSIMTVELVDLKGELTVEAAFERIRKIGPDSETIYTCYVTDKTRHLEGIVPVKALLLAAPDAIIDNIMDEDYVYAKTTDDQEIVAHLFEKYNLLNIPVVDSEKRLVGIITIDDIVDVIKQEATEDFEIMAAMRPSEKPYLRTGVLTLARNRIGWLLVLMVSGMITGSILANYEAAIASIPLLVTFIPMLTNTGGNAGSQSSTMVIRGMALQEIKTGDFPKIWRKELMVSLIVGTILSAVNYVRLCIQYPGNELLAVTVGVSLLLTVIIAQTLGGLLPIFAKLCRADPAVMAAPMITTIVDAFSLAIFFQIASYLFKLM